VDNIVDQDADQDADRDRDLLHVIRDEIRSNGPITFARYMELALYHPELGFYRKGERFGIAGDFYTGEQLTPVFGEILSRFVQKLTMRSSWKEPFAVLELGAGRGDMKGALSPWSYRAFDWGTPSLPDTWHGLVFANEFFDALPVHLLVKRGDEWRELRVGLEREGLGFTEAAPETTALTDYALLYGGAIPDGGRLEMCPGVADWCETISSLLVSGCLLVIDYGYHTRELLRFPEGTLMSYRKHHAEGTLLSEPGARDITAHVHFNWLSKCAEAVGLRLVESSTLANWALSLWTEDELQDRWNGADSRWRLQWKHLIFGLGETFRVLQFEKRAA
jgi:SAM-dependent MidA family methyltransferase